MARQPYEDPRGIAVSETHLLVTCYADDAGSAGLEHFDADPRAKPEFLQPENVLSLPYELVDFCQIPTIEQVEW
jgi:hypothetical protein